jgi:hypothetical protein
MTQNRQQCLIWVEVGRRLPRYAKNNFELLKNMSPLTHQVLITDADVVLDGVETIPINSIPMSSQTQDFLQISRDTINHQDYFWHGTTSRFFYLYDYMRFRNLESAVHIETDVVILDFACIEKLFESPFGLAYPLQNQNIGVASIFAVKEMQVFEEFLNFIKASWWDSRENDMSLLGKFATHQGVRVLPTSLEQICIPNENEIYDAGTLGPFFMGAESRNFRIPMRYRGKLLNSPFSGTETITDDGIVWEISTRESAVELLFKKNGTCIQVINLHLHSKKIPRKRSELLKALKNGFTSKRGISWRLGGLDFFVFLERTISFIFRRLHIRNPNRNLR